MAGLNKLPYLQTANAPKEKMPTPIQDRNSEAKDALVVWRFR